MYKEENITKEMTRQAEIAVRQAMNDLVICQKAVLTSDEAAKYLGISKSALYKLTMANQVPYSKPNGKLMYFSRQELEDWLMSNRVSTANEIAAKAQDYCMKGGKK